MNKLKKYTVIADHRQRRRREGVMDNIMSVSEKQANKVPTSSIIKNKCVKTNVSEKLTSLST